MRRRPFVHNFAQAHPDLAGEPDLTIHAVSAEVGVPSPTIRSWERRYGLPIGQRTSGGHRRYNGRDVALLVRMRDEVSAGRPPAAVAEALNASVAETPSVMVETFLHASQRLDAQAVWRVLDRAAELYGLAGAIEQVLIEAMRQIGSRWAAADCDVAHEHLATAASQSWLSRRRHAAGPPWRACSIVLGCGPADLHTLGLEAFAVLLAHEGFDCRMLGGQTPVESARLAVDEVQADAVVIVSHFPRARPQAVASLHTLSRTRANVFYAGGAFQSDRTRRGVPGTYLGDSLSEAAEGLAANPPARR